MAGVTAKDAAEVTAEAGRGTIGVVVLDSRGQLAVGTSTGGKGFERIGRVSDSAMPAGNYATSAAAVSCTGIGEHIVDECFAARVVIRVTDGMPIQTAFDKSFYEAGQRDRDFGAIGIGADGTIAWGKTSEVLIAACHDGDRIQDTLETEVGVADWLFLILGFWFSLLGWLRVPRLQHIETQVGSHHSRLGIPELSRRC